MHVKNTIKTRLKSLLEKDMHDMHGFRYSLSLSLLLLLKFYITRKTRANVQIQYRTAFENAQDRVFACIFVFYYMFC